MRVRVFPGHGKYYATAAGRDVERLRKARRRLLFWQYTLAGQGETPDAALEDLAALVRALRRSNEREVEYVHICHREDMP